MSEDLRKAMLREIVALCTNIAELNTTADELVRTANQLDGHPVSEAMRNIARQKRVKVLEMQGQFAVLNAAYTERFGTER